jgi:CRP-like cAMP-binding protein
MMSIAEFQDVYQKLKSSQCKSDSERINETDRRIFQSFLEFLTAKFFETSSIFQKFDYTSAIKFCQESIFENFEQIQKIFSKGQECNSYYFVLFGDINLYDEDSEININQFSSLNKLMKTISGGSVYGHKIKSIFNYLALAKNSTQLLKIHKTKFDNIIDDTNKRKDDYKINFLKKYFPKLRMYSDDVLKTLKPFFLREEYYKGSKILIDSEYDEYLYLIIDGTLGVAKSIKKIKNLKEKILLSARINLNHNENSGNLNCGHSDLNSNKLKYVVLEKFNKGDVFGAYSALKHQKNNYTVVVLSERAQIYKLSKAHCIYYFGGSSGIIPETLRGIDNTQQSSIHYKLDFLEKSENLELISRFLYIADEEENSTMPKKAIDESVIENKLKDAWKELENLGSKISQFKETLLNKNPTAASKQNDLFGKLKTNTNEVECN